MRKLQSKDTFDKDKSRSLNWKQCGKQHTMFYYLVEISQYLQRNFNFHGNLFIKVDIHANLVEIIGFIEHI